MKPNNHRKQAERADWERAATRSSADVLAILAPAANEPSAIQRMGIWKTGPANEPIRSAA